MNNFEILFDRLRPVFSYGPNGDANRSGALVRATGDRRFRAGKASRLSGLTLTAAPTGTEGGGGATVRFATVDLSTSGMRFSARRLLPSSHVFDSMLGRCPLAQFALAATFEGPVDAEARPNNNDENVDRGGDHHEVQRYVA